MYIVIHNYDCITITAIRLRRWGIGVMEDIGAWECTRLMFKKNVFGFFVELFDVKSPFISSFSVSAPSP